MQRFRQKIMKGAFERDENLEDLQKINSQEKIILEWKLQIEGESKTTFHFNEKLDNEV